MTWSISNYSTTPASNTAINGINIAPGCPASSAGPFMRQLMADIATALAAGQFLPPGIIVHFPTSTAPAGYLACDGSAVSRTTYASLFALIGTTYGVGDGSTTFNLPDIRGRSIAGYDSANASGRLTTSATGGVSASTVGNTGGEQAHALTIAELAAHTHTDAGHTHTSSSGNAFLVANAGASGATGSGSLEADNTTNTGHASLNNTGSGTAHNNVHPTIIMLPCIKT